MYKWIHCFLQDRSARVKLDGYMSESVKMREGVPQGGVISPTLFLLYINNITTILGAMKSTPIAMMENTTGVEPLESRRQAKLLTHGENMKRLPDHPLWPSKTGFRTSPRIGSNGAYKRDKLTF